MATFLINFGYNRISLTQKLLFAKNMSLMLQSGLTVTEALNVAADAENSAFKKVILEIGRVTQAGNTLADGLALFPQVFSGFFINTVRAGEASGTLEGNLTHAALQLEKDQELRSKVKGAMLYPAIVILATCVLGLALAFLVLPKITPLFEGLHIQLPFTTRALIWFSHLIQNYGVILLIGIFGFIFLLVFILRQKFSRPFNHFVLLHAPVFKKLTHNAALARFSLTIGTLLKAGLPLDESLIITTSTIGNYFYERALQKVTAEVRTGTPVSQNLEHFANLFPPLLTRMIQVGEKSGKLEQTFLYLANYYEREVDVSTKSLATAIEPVLLLIIGSAVAFLALSIITPIYNITGSIH